MDVMRHRLATTDFSHVAGSTEYMRIVVGLIDALGDGLEVLDIPAGDGFVVDELRRRGHTVVGADINKEHPDFTYANMEQELPFADAQFDVVSCLEGIEHVLDENRLLAELVRVVRPGGAVVLSTPNVMNLYSRWHTFWHGYPYQFPPGSARHLPDRQIDRQIDRGHVNPLSYLRLRYLLEAHGTRIVALDGDRTKKRVLLPIMLPVAWVGRLLTRQDFRFGDADDEHQRSIDRDLASRPVRMARSLIIVARKC